jgi:hypothetical protein
MSDKRASMVATLNDIRSKPSTPRRDAAAARLEEGIAKIDAYEAKKAAYAARNGSGGKRARYITPYDRLELNKIVDDRKTSPDNRDRAKKILDGHSLTEKDVEFLRRLKK